VNTVDYDDQQFIASLKSTYKFWWHVDAAFGGFAACSSQYNHLLKGWEQADSITIDNHKWLNVPYDSAVIFTRKEHAALQVQTFQNSNAPYLGDPFENFSYLNYVPENSRRFRALPAWFTLMAYGKEGYRELVDKNIQLAQQLGTAIEKSLYFELVAPVRLNTVCFTVKGEENRKERIAELLLEMNKRGKVFMTPTVYLGQTCIRAALVNWRTTEEDLAIAMNELNEAYQLIKK
jgi:glutamate/tyrosine decarboxylase-like PLP-dependent enzyme